VSVVGDACSGLRSGLQVVRTGFPLLRLRGVEPGIASVHLSRSPIDDVNEDEVADVNDPPTGSLWGSAYSSSSPAFGRRVADLIAQVSRLGQDPGPNTQQRGR